MKRNPFILLTLLLAFALATSRISAQRGFQYADSVPHPPLVCGIPGTPPCPTTPPRPQPTSPPPRDTPVPSVSDRDGDGVPDDADRCPDVGGPASNNGCPLDQAATLAPTLAPTIALPLLPSVGDCMLATRSIERVNVRAEPSLQAEIVGMLDPQVVYPVIAALKNAAGNWNRLAEGWAAGWVTRMGGSCNTIPQVSQLGGPDTSPNPALLSHPDGSGFAFGDGSVHPDQDLMTGFCSNGGKIAWHSSADPTSQIVFNLTFGNNAPEASPQPHLAPGQWCAKADPATQGIIIDYNQGGFADWSFLQGFGVHLYAGFDPGTGEFPTETILPAEAVLIAIIEPRLGQMGEEPIPGNQSPLMLVWHVPFDPNAQGIIINYNMGIDPETGVFVINWLPSGVDLDPEGITVGCWGMPAEVDPNMQAIMLHFFPHGFDPNAQGIITNYFPGSIDPNAQRILITEDQPVSEGVKVEFEIQ